MIVNLNPQNGSGEAGTAAFFAVGEATRAVITVRGEPAAGTQPANIHAGRCGRVEAIRYVLHDVRSGRSTTLLRVSLRELTTGGLVVNIQASPASLHAAKEARSVSCGSIPAGSASL